MNDVKFSARMSELFKSGMSKIDVQRTLRLENPTMDSEAVRSRVRRYCKKLQRECELSDKNSDKSINKTDGDICERSQSFEYHKDGSTVFERIIALPKGENVTPEKVLAAHGLSTDLWEVISCKSNFYQQQKKGGSIINLYQSKVTVKPIHFAVSFDDVKKKFDELQNNFIPLDIKEPASDARYLYEINIADLHLGKFASDFETGEILNSGIAEKRFYEVIEKECNNIKQFGNKIEKILFVWTNDFFNSDGISKATTGGTVQDTDTKWQELYLKGVNLLINAIDTLSKIAPVKTFYIASNHSRQTDYYAICTLQAWFRNYKHVEIDIVPHTRHYERYGVNLIGFAHSYYEKKQNLPHLMSVERKEDWGQTSYREYHLAHYHSEKVEEKGGVIFRWLPSITGEDTWTTDCGFVGAVRRSYSFVYDKDKGLVQINSTIVD